ncbi:hypothetical protein OIE69_42660 [Actinacidiphila glaucinigra]|uniref:hypothetical protein n=1 Tax=Actinacidiphila glaucinigra TaxID=235986 RepID=UPI002DD8AB5D|nr:hypothetical protein [Actinacidiphila glaucinigra]WSD65097.1 hypothetical protein OIE69_42660 [Actinacidiphila glaucinigra]
MSEQQWTIQSISDALGDPELSQRFLSQINRAPAHELLDVFARWERIAKNTLAAVERARVLAAAEERGEEPPGEWIDVTDKILAEAERIRSRGAA